MNDSLNLTNETSLSDTTNNQETLVPTNSESSQVLATADIIAIWSGITLAFLTIALVWLTWVLIKLTKKLVQFAGKLDDVSKNTLKSSLHTLKTADKITEHLSNNAVSGAEERMWRVEMKEYVGGIKKYLEDKGDGKGKKDAIAINIDNEKKYA